jgi:TetR/AcrR family transcriptional repressor of nem operon
MWTSEWKTAMDACFSPTVDPLDRLRNHLLSVVEMQNAVFAKSGKVLGCPLASVGCEISTSEADVCGAVRSIFTRKRRYYESAIRDAVAVGVIPPCDPAQKALAFHGLVNGMVSHARIMNDPAVLATLPELGLDLLGAATRRADLSAETAAVAV